MRPRIALSLCLAAALGCHRSPSNERRYTLQGQILAIDAGRTQATIKHEEIKGLMPAMTMPYKLHDAGLVSGMKPGDLINATLIVAENDAYLIEVRKVGDAPLEKPPADAPPPTAAGPELLTPGDAVPDASFVDENGKKRTLASFKGSTLVVTFIYTSCPLPTFCPLMDRHFATIQKGLTADPALGGVHLLSVSFDPSVDTPAVLKKHAHDLGADPGRWTFLTGDEHEIDRFGAALGLSVGRAGNDGRDISHNLRTAIIDRNGKLNKIYIGNEWTPTTLLADLKPVVQGR